MKVTLENFDKAVSDILKEYAEEEGLIVEETIKVVAQSGVRALRSEARSKFKRHTGDYASGWKVKMEHKINETSAVIYNARVPGLPHLLEYGHAKVGGGRVAGRAHIKPVEDEIIRKLDKELKAKL